MKDKTSNFIGIRIKLAIICYFLPNGIFDTSQGWYFICNVLMNSNLSFHNFWPTFDWNQYKMLMSAKGQAYFQILFRYFINVRLTICFIFALNWTNKKKRKWNSNIHLPPTYVTSEKANFCMVKFPNSLKLSYIWKCLDKTFFHLKLFL